MGRRLGGEGAREETRIEVLAMSGELARHDGRESLALQSAFEVLTDRTHP